MGVLDGYDANRLQFVSDALRTMSAPALDLTKNGDRAKLNTSADSVSKSGRPAIRNSDGTTMTIAQIATSANLTSAQVQDLAGRI